MTEAQIVVLMIVALIFLIMLGHPVAFTVGGIAMLFGVVWWGGPGTFDILAKNVFGVMDNYIFAAIPMFILMGAILERSGVGEILYKSMHIIMGRLRGGLAVATVFICTLFAASTGIIATSVVGMGMFALPAMVKRGYSKELATGAVMAGGCLGILIPPSIMLVVIGAMAGLSVGKLFMGALFPGLVLSGLYMAFITISCFLRPHWGPALPPEERAVSPLKKALLGITSVLPPLALIFAVLGSIFFGLASPTEAASVGAAGAVLITLGYRKFSWKTIKEASYETALSTGMIFWIIVGASCYAAVFLGLGGDQIIADLLLGLQVSPMVVLGVILFTLFILGMVMEWIAIALIAIPIFFPIVIELGFDPLWFAVLFAVVLQTAFLTPPYGGALFLLRGIAPEGVTMGNIWRGAYLYIPFQLVGLTLCVLYPKIVLWLPTLMID